MQDPQADAPNNLAQAEAKLRRSAVSPDSLEYTLHLDLSAKAKDYTGKLSFKFDVTKVPTNKGELFLDFVGQEIERIQANGKSVSENPFSGSILRLCSHRRKSN
jgi:aminopeptidase N